MEDPVGTVVIGIGPADYTNHRQVLTVRAGNSIDHAQPANRERDDAGANSPGPGIAVGGVPGVELVAATDRVELGLGDQVVQEGQVEIAGDGEDVRHSDLDEAPSEVTTQSADGGAGADRQGSGAGASRGADLSSCIHLVEMNQNAKLSSRKGVTMSVRVWAGDGPASVVLYGFWETEKPVGSKERRLRRKTRSQNCRWRGFWNIGNAGLCIGFESFLFLVFW